MSTIGVAYNQLTVELKVVFLRNDTPGIEGAHPKLPPTLGALYFDSNKALSSLDTRSICASACCRLAKFFCPQRVLLGWKWLAERCDSTPCLQLCFKAGPPKPTLPPTPLPATFYCDVPGYECQVIQHGGQYNTLAQCKQQCPLLHLQGHRYLNTKISRMAACPMSRLCRSLVLLVIFVLPTAPPVPAQPTSLPE